MATGRPLGANPAVTAPRYIYETYFPNIRNHLLNPTPGVELRVVCSTCTENLDIKGINPVSDEDSTSNPEPARVLRCGHVVGQNCFRQWVVTQFEGDSGPVHVLCPTCRADMACPYCGHLMAEVTIPGANSVYDVTDVPLLQVEAYGENEDAARGVCEECHLRILLCAAVWMMLRGIQNGQDNSTDILTHDTLRAIVENKWVKFVQGTSQQMTTVFSPSPMLRPHQRPRYLASVRISSSATMPVAVRRGLESVAGMINAGLVPALYMPMWTVRDPWARMMTLNSLWEGKWPPEVGEPWTPRGTSVAEAVTLLIGHVENRYAGEGHVLKRIQMMWCEVGNFVDPRLATLMGERTGPYRERSYLYGHRFNRPVEEGEEDDGIE